MRVMILCPGSWTHGLYSPERGEGRWAQNYAKMLGEAGHEVFAASGGSGQGQYTVPGVTLIPERKIGKYGPYDLYIDPAWWDGKTPGAGARCYVHLHWSLEAHLRQPLPAGHVIAYPYPSQRPFFDHPVNPNREHTYALPTPFADEFAPVVSTDGPIFLCGRGLHLRWGEVLLQLLPYLQSREIVGVYGADLPTEVVNLARQLNVRLNLHASALPYNELRSLLRKCSLNLTIAGPSNILDATAEGVPTTIWEEGGFFLDDLSCLGITIPRSGLVPSGAPLVGDILHRMLTEPSLRAQVVERLQFVLQCHQTKEALQHFSQLISQERLG